MSDDPASQIAALRKLRQSSTDLTQVAALDAAIAALQLVQRAQGQQSTTIAGPVTAPVLSGTFHGPVYIDGRRADEADRLLRGYLEQLRARCGSLPLQALYQLARHDDRHAIELAAVYTQLAVDQLVEREAIESQAERDQFDAEAYLNMHVGAHLLPLQQRDALWAEDSDEAAISRAARRRGASHPLGTGAELARMEAADLQRIIQNPTFVRLAFTGPQLVSEAIAANQRLVLLGEPGSGKSTALRYLALTLAEAALDSAIALPDKMAGWARLGDQGRLLPLFLPLLPFARKLAAIPQLGSSAADLWTHTVETLEPGGVRTGLAEAVHAELSAGRALLLLDGLDEVAGVESRTRVVRAVAQFAAEYPRCRVVVSCRARAYQGEQNTAWQLPGWPVVTLVPWGHAQQQFFIDAWYRAAVAAGSLPEAQSAPRVGTLQRAVAASPDLQRLAASPLLLTVMALVHLNDGRLPEDRVTLYSRCIDILLAQWEQRGKDASDYGPLMAYIGLPERDIQRLRPLLTRAAYMAHLAGTSASPGALARETLRGMAMDYLAERLDHPNPYQGAQRLLEYTDHRAGLLQASAAGDAYIFPHLTFQEYLAGLELTSGSTPVTRVMAHRRDDRWRLPIFLGIGDFVSGGKLETPYRLLNELLSHPEPLGAEGQRDAVFAAELALDVGWDRLNDASNSYRKLQRDLAAALAGVVEGRALPAAERVRVGELLGRIGDLRPGVCSLPPAMVEFAGGSLSIGAPRSPSQDAGEINEHVVRVAPFALARYLVTNAQWEQFWRAEGYDPDKPWWDAVGRAWLRRDGRTQPSYWEDHRFGQRRANAPVVGVTWYEAMAFCRWLTQQLDDGRIYTLPSELEWELAARGATQRMYPWGDAEPDDEHANYAEAYGGTTAVGCFLAGATPGGLLDMAGNVWEWTRSVYRPHPYGAAEAHKDKDVGKPPNRRYVLRGGGWDNLPIVLRTPYRISYAPDDLSFVGLRLARGRATGQRGSTRA